MGVRAMGKNLPKITASELSAYVRLVEGDTPGEIPTSKLVAMVVGEFSGVRKFEHRADLEKAINYIRNEQRQEKPAVAKDL